jgi:hypothetical protein
MESTEPEEVEESETEEVDEHDPQQTENVDQEAEGMNNPNWVAFLEGIGKQDL